METKFPKMYVDKNRMQAVFHNLIINAIKYSYDRKRYERKYDIVIRGGCNNDGSYCISVLNYGIEIPSNLIEDIFINGNRAAEAKKIDPGGKGFGLALVKNIIEMHQAKIFVSNSGTPTEFKMVFPSWIADISPDKKIKEVNNDPDNR